MVICQYCGYGNPDSAGECQKCGAPRRHMVYLSTIQKVQTVFREISTGTGELDWPVRMYDSSAWNGAQNGAVTKTKAQAGYIRAGYGNEVKDPKLDYFRNAAMSNGLEHGLYWFCYIGQDWRQHANSFYSLWRTAPGKLFPWIDCETTTLTPSQTLAWIKNMVDCFEDLTGVESIIYTSAGFWNSRVARSTWAGTKLLAVANYTSAASPLLPYDWTNWLFWQWSADGNRKAAEYGFTGGDLDLDLDRFNGSIPMFNQMFHTNIQPLGETVPPPPPVEPVMPMYLGQVTASALNIRALPNAASADLGDLKFGDKLPIVEERDGWCRVSGWVSKTYIREV